MNDAGTHTACNEIIKHTFQFDETSECPMQFSA